MAEHHPNEELLATYAIGGLSTAQSVLIATHLTLCGDCRAICDSYDAIGGALLSDSLEEPITSELMNSVMAHLEDPELESSTCIEKFDDHTSRIIPAPLRAELAVPISSIVWKKLGNKVDYVELATDEPSIKARILRLAPGTRMPSHTHTGTEMTVVLAGGFSDKFGHYQRGDVAVLDHDDVHDPKVDEGEECLCYVVTDAPLKFIGFIGLFLNRWLKW